MDVETIKSNVQIDDYIIIDTCDSMRRMYYSGYVKRVTDNYVHISKEYSSDFPYDCSAIPINCILDINIRNPIDCDLGI